MIQSKFNTPNKVREMLKLLLDERVSISEQTEGECAEIIVLFNGVSVTIRFICNSMESVILNLEGKSKPFGYIKADAVVFELLGDNFCMQTVHGNEGVKIIMPKKADIEIKQLCKGKSKKCERRKSSG